MDAAAGLSLFALSGIKLVEPGDDLALIASEAFARNAIAAEDGDVLVVAQKIVSKAEGRFLDLASITPSPRALALAARLDKDPRLVEAILAQSKRVVRQRPGLLIVEHRLGFVMANAGIDRSNVAPGEERILLLPADPDGSAASLRRALGALLGRRLGVIISDSFGRPHRRGVVGVALGSAGLPALVDQRGRADLFGRPLKVTETAFADEIAAAASLLMGQADEALPMVLVRGLLWSAPENPASTLVRPPEHDLFR